MKNELQSKQRGMTLMIYLEDIKRYFHSPAWKGMNVISALCRLKQEDCEFEASLGYIARS
jgi:hypothetical protein